MTPARSRQPDREIAMHPPNPSPVAARAAFLILLTSCLVLPASRAAAAGADRGQSVVAGWEERIQEADAEVRSGDWKHAERSLDALLDEMTEALADGPAALSLLGRAEALRGLAEAGLSQDRAAVWDWTVAVALLPAVATMDLGGYGEAGERLEVARRAEAPAATELPAGATPPAPRKSPRIVYPEARLRRCDPAPVQVAATVGLEGAPRAPELDPEHAVVGFVTLESLRDWKFDPATVAGKPVDARFTLRTAWTKKLCRELLSAQRRGLPAGSDEDEAVP
jgi:hypothetical protein